MKVVSIGILNIRSENKKPTKKIYIFFEASLSYGSHKSSKTAFNGTKSKQKRSLKHFKNTQRSNCKWWLTYNFRIITGNSELKILRAKPNRAELKISKKVEPSRAQVIQLGKMLSRAEPSWARQKVELSSRAEPSPTEYEWIDPFTEGGGNLD